MRLPSLLLLAACVGVLAGCGDTEHEDIKQWMKEQSRDMHGSVPPLPELNVLPIVSYDAQEEIDPFSAARVVPEKRDGAGRRPDLDRPREQLEYFPLESMQYVGIVKKHKSGMRHALIKVDGVIYQVRVGNYLGQDFGRIVAINDTEVVLKEIVQDPTGHTTDWVEREATLQLQDGTQGKEAGKK